MKPALSRKNLAIIGGVAGVTFVGVLLIVILWFNSPDTASIALSLAGELSSEEYDILEANLISLFEKEGSRAALTRLTLLMQADARVLNSCHPIAHSLGNAVYNHFKDFGKALSYQDEICNSGFIHGVIESGFGNSSDIKKDLQKVCQDYAPGTFMHWQCHHGVGHGLMFSSKNDLPKSEELCETYSDKVAQSACVNGVFMENFNVDGKLHISKYLNMDDPFAPCRADRVHSKEDCYFYVPIHVLSIQKGAFREALALCDPIPAPFDLTCAGGVGFQTLKRNVKNISFVEGICGGSSSKNLSAACVGGMANFYVHQYSNFKEAEWMCDSLRRKNRSACRASISDIQKLFPGEAT